MATPTERTFSLFEAASIIGVTRNTLAKWLNEGCPYVTKGDRARGVEWELSIAQIFEWRRAKDVQEAVSKYQDQQGAITLDEAKRRRAVSEALVSEIEADEALRRVVDIGFVSDWLAALMAALKTRLGSIGAKVAGRAASMTNPAAIKELIDQEIRDALKGTHDAVAVGPDKSAKAG